MKDTYKIADLVIDIDSIYDAVHRFCLNYRVNDMDAQKAAADISVHITQQDIDFERVISARVRAREGRGDEPEPSDAYLEVLAVYRKIAEKIPFFDTVLMHGSCIAVDGAAYIFIAKSGTGKSTHTRLWRELLRDRAVMVNDDKPLIRAAEAGTVIYGTPWDGKHKLSTNIAVPLKAVCILERAEQNSIQEVTAAEAYLNLIQQTYRPMDPSAMEKTLTLIDRLAASVRLWRLGCNMDPEAAEIAYTAMKD